jgi:uncharacterized protein YggT (Ycf19 family)
MHLHANICKQIFAWIWNLLEVLWIFASKRIFWSEYSPVWENVKRIFAMKQIFASTCICFASNWLFVYEFVRIFRSEYKANDVNKCICEYTETCENGANKIHIRLDSLRSIRRTLLPIVSASIVSERAASLFLLYYANCTPYVFV